MPIYDYKCLNCDYEFESLQNVGSSAILCQKCGSGMATLQMGTPAFKINGYTEKNGYGLKEAGNE